MRKGCQRLVTAVGRLRGDFFVGVPPLVSSAAPFSNKIFLSGRPWKSSPCGIVVALGTIVTALSSACQAILLPACAFLLCQAPALNPIHFRLILDTLISSTFWSQTMLAIGLSASAAVSFKESAFWVFGYWFVARVALILLG